MLKDFNDTFVDELKDPEYVAAYLDEAIRDGIPTFLVAMQDVAKANGGMSKLAQETGLGRESLYKSLSDQGNPEIKTLLTILQTLGIRMTFLPGTHATKQA